MTEDQGMAQVGYVVGGSDGWLRVRREGDGGIVALPSYLKVEIGEVRQDRQHFRVLEGVEAGNAFHVKSGNLKPGNPGYRGAIQLRFEIAKGLVHYAGGQARAITHPTRPVPAGVHPIQIPDFPHASGSTYTGRSPYALTWMYLGRGHAPKGHDDRYLHCGNASDGCITVRPEDWTVLYNSLILCRSGDGKTLGSVSVVR
jgi:hypothetical protein